jgi:5-methyltetrahydrofolate--homocysteine methyltransferase
LGASILGGCCGTTPEFIKELNSLLSAQPSVTIREQKKDAVCSAKRVVELKDLKIETIEPSQEKKTAIVEAYLNNDTDYLTEMALEQEDDGAEIINLNLSLLDEKNCPLENIEIALQAISTVSALPVYIDSDDKDIVLTALRAFEGRALVKANGDAISELALYGAAII